MSTTGNVALILGSEDKNEKIKSKLETNLDNYNYIPFTSLMKALEFSRGENKDFDRLIIFENRLANSKGVVRGDDDPRVDAIKNLNDYVLDGRGETEIILICTSDKPTGVHKAFVEILENPYATPVLVERFTVSLMKELVSKDVDSIRASYYDLDHARVEKLIVEPEEEEVEKTESKSDSSGSDKKSKLLSLFGRKNHSSGVLDSAGKISESLGKTVGDVEAAKNSEYQSSQSIDEDDDDDEFAGPAGDLGYSESEEGEESEESSSDIGNDYNDDLDFSSAGANHEVTGLFDEEDDDDEPHTANQSSGEEGYEDGYEDYYHEEQHGHVEEGTGLIEESGTLEPSHEHHDVSVSYPTQAMPVVEQYEDDYENYNDEYEAEEYDEPNSYDYNEEYDEEDEEDDDLPVVRHRIVVVTGGRGNGLTNTTATYATKFISDDNKVLIIDADFAKSGMVGYVSDMADFMSNDHSILSGNPYIEGDLDILSNGYDTEMTPEDIEWINDSRNYAEYGRVVIDCPLEFLDNLRPLLKHAGIVVMVDGNPTGMINMVRALNDKFMVPDELAQLIRKRGIYYTIRKEDDFDEVLSGLKDTLIFDRVNWLANIA